jgi:hypothetical protein
VTEPSTIHPADLWRLVEELTKPTTKRIVRDDGAVQHAVVPALWGQLVDAIEHGRGSGERSAPGSRAPVAVEAVSLKNEIESFILATLSAWGERQSEFMHSAQSHRILDVDGATRRLTSIVIRDDDERQTKEWHNRLGSWCSQIRATIRSDRFPPIPLRGVACTSCGRRKLMRIEVDGGVTGTFLDDPLTLHRDDLGQPAKATCGGCHSEFTGLAGLEQLAACQDRLPPDPEARRGLIEGITALSEDVVVQKTDLL